MTRDEIELVPEQVKAGKITWEQAVREMIVFIVQNKGLFVLYKYDEDFISELIWIADRLLLVNMIQNKVDFIHFYSVL